MGIRHLRDVYFRGQYHPFDYHSDDGCYHCAGYMDATIEGLEQQLLDAKQREAASRSDTVQHRPTSLTETE